MNYGWYAWNGLLFSTLNPVFFFNGLDFTLNILMLTNLQHFLLNNYWLRIAFDVIFLFLPVILTITIIYGLKISKLVSVITIFFTIVYALFFSTVSYISMQGYMGWILIPVILSSSAPKAFYYNLHIIRIIFILIFVSAGIQKIASGAIFNIGQMAAILVRQHSLYIISGAENWFTRCIYFFVNHQKIAFSFYLLGLIAELIFAVGFFTRKYDRFLILIFVFFLVFDYYLMQIYYFSWLVFAGCFYFSSYSLNEKKNYG